MTLIRASTLINATIETCFRLSLSIDLELRAGGEHGIGAVSGVTSGQIKYGERVTWKTTQFGLRISHTSEITEFDEPVYFQDRMVRGLFRSFQHDHFFHPIAPNQTEMRDEMRFRMPILLMGQLAENLIVKRRLAALLLKRNSLIKSEAESGSL